MEIEIPTEYEPHPAQIPAWADDEWRFRLCFAIARAITLRDFDPVFVRELYFGDLPTDDVDGDGLPADAACS